MIIILCLLLSFVDWSAERASADQEAKQENRFASEFQRICA